MTTKFLTFIGVLLLASIAQAEPPARPRFSDLAPYIASAVKLADPISSVRFSSNGSGCSEGVARYRNPDGSFNAGKGFVETGAVVAASWLLLWAARKSSNKTAIKIAEVENYFAGAWGAKSAIRNLAHCGF